jgi:hypothetical protein
MNKLFVVLVSFISFMFICCDQEDTAEKKEISWEEALNKKIEERESETFTIPDSINTSLIIATYYEEKHEESPNGHSIILYADSTKSSAVKIKYLSDSTALTDKLKSVKYNEFKSIYYNIGYVVKEHVVSEIYVVANLSHSRDFDRTDKN